MVVECHNGDCSPAWFERNDVTGGYQVTFDVRLGSNPVEIALLSVPWMQADFRDVALSPGQHVARPGDSGKMCAALSVGITSDEATAPWSVAAAGSAPIWGWPGSGARLPLRWPQEIVSVCRRAAGPPRTRRSCAALRIARLLLTGTTARATAEHDDEGAPGPRDQPLNIRRRAFRSVIDWRMATSRLRRLLPARAPQRVRRIPTARGLAAAADPSRAPPPWHVHPPDPDDAVWGVASFVEILGTDGLSYLDITQTVVFAVLLLWLSQSFWTLAGGAAVLAARLLRRRRLAPPQPRPPGLPRVAVVAPIYNEDTDARLRRLRAMWEDLRHPAAQRAGSICSSSATRPIRTSGWPSSTPGSDMRQAVPGGDRIFYRRRLRNRAAQDRQHRGLRHPLGRRLRLHDRAGCRQPDVRPRDDAAGRADGCQSRRSA